LGLLACIDRRQRQSREHLLEEGVELIATHASLEFETLNSGRCETTAPRPAFQVAQRLAAVDDLIVEEGERRPLATRRQIAQLLVRRIDRRLA
jgi:hypothetical protein